MPAAALLALALSPLVLAGCGGGGKADETQPGVTRVTAGGASVAVPDSFQVDQHVEQPEVLGATASGEIRPDQPRLGVAVDDALGNLGQAAAEDLHSNTLGLLDRRVVSDLRAVDVPGAKAAYQAEYEFTSGFKNGTRRWRTHVWVRYATPGDHRVYALSVVVPSVAKEKPDVEAILRSFRLTT